VRDEITDSSEHSRGQLYRAPGNDEMLVLMTLNTRTRTNWHFHFNKNLLVWKNWKFSGFDTCQGFYWKSGKCRKESCRGKVAKKCLLLVAWDRWLTFTIFGYTVAADGIGFYAVLLLWSHCKLNSSTIDINTSSTDTWYELSLSMGTTAMHCHGISQRLDSGHGTHITHSL